MWLLTCLHKHFEVATTAGNIELLRACIAIVVILKAVASLAFGDWDRLAEGSYVWWRVASRRGATVAKVVAYFQKPSLIIRLVAGLFLVIPVFPRVLICVIVVCNLHELVHDRRHHTIFITLVLGALAFAGNYGHAFVFDHTRSTANTFAQFLVALTLIDVYLNSAWHKIRSRHFRSGLFLSQIFYVGASVAGQQTVTTYVHPSRIATRSDAAGAVSWHWRLAAAATIVIEAAMPVGLLIPQTRVIAAFSGATMHAAFVPMLPVKLLPFSVACVACYLAFGVLGGHP